MTLLSVSMKLISGQWVRETSFFAVEQLVRDAGPRKLCLVREPQTRLSVSGALPTVGKTMWTQTCNCGRRAPDADHPVLHAQRKRTLSRRCVVHRNLQSNRENVEARENIFSRWAPRAGDSAQIVPIQIHQVEESLLIELIGIDA
jgi:hypothetical protein